MRDELRLMGLVGLVVAVWLALFVLIYTFVVQMRDTTHAQSSNLCTITNAANPVFDASACTVFQLQLGPAATVTGSSIANDQPGQILTFIISQDSIGNRAFPWPATMSHVCAISPVPNVMTIVVAVAIAGPSEIAISCSTTDQGSLISGPVRPTPSNPPDGLSCWFASVAGGANLKCLDPAGNVHAAVLAGPTRDPSWFIRYIDPDGIPSMGRFQDYETPSGVIDGSNKVFTLQHFPHPATNLILVLDGAVQLRGKHFNLNGGTVSFVVAPQPGSIMVAWYRW